MAYVANDAFCLQIDVEAKAQRGPYTSGTFPTAQQVLDAMAFCGSQIEGVLSRFGVPYTVPSRATPFPAYGTAGKNQEDRLRLLCQEANAFGAAVRAVQMQDASARQTDSELIKALSDLFVSSMEALEIYCEQTFQSAAASASVNAVAPIKIPTAVSRDEPFGYDTEW